MREHPITWVVLRRDFLDCFFSREKRESKEEEFIKLHQGGMSVREYSLKFTKLSKYAPSLVSNPRDQMSHFIIGVFNDLVEECRLDMVHDNMHIYCLVVHAQEVEEHRLKRKNREAKGV